MHRITEELLCSYAAARGVNLSQLVVWPLEVLNLHGNNIRKIEGLEKLPKLRVLVLSFNEIHKIEVSSPIPPLYLPYTSAIPPRCLRHISAISPAYLPHISATSPPHLPYFQGLEELRQLQRLELGFNLIKRIEGLKGLEVCGRYGEI